VSVVRSRQVVRAVGHADELLAGLGLDGDGFALGDVSEPDSKRVAEIGERVLGGVAHPALDLADLALVDAGLRLELFLTHPSVGAKHRDLTAKLVAMLQALELRDSLGPLGLGLDLEILHEVGECGLLHGCGVCDRTHIWQNPTFGLCTRSAACVPA
jgi:hypothetical protein